MVKLASFKALLIFEDVFSYLGGCSKRQITLVLLVAYTGLPSALIELNVILTQAVPQHRCTIPIFDNSQQYKNIAESDIINLAIQKISRP